MKFKALFIVFNIVFLAIFLTVFFMPLSMLGGTALGSFWATHWTLGLLFAAIVISVNGIFAAWWRLLGLLEAQDWAGLANYLEKKVYNQRFVTASSIRLFLESSFLIGDFEGIQRLSERLGAVSPPRQARFAHRIAAALIVGGRYADAKALSSIAAEHPGAERDWALFFVSFTETLLGNPFPTGNFTELVDSARDPMVVALSGYLNGKPGRDAEAAKRARERILARFNRKKWEALLRDMGGGIHVIVLSSLLGEVTAWLYGDASAADGAPAGKATAGS